METYVGYGSRGLERNDFGMALHYGLQAIGQVPWRPAGWRLLARIVLRVLVRRSRKRALTAKP
jgi:hypothetical protein